MISRLVHNIMHALIDRSLEQERAVIAARLAIGGYASVAPIAVQGDE